MADGPFGNLENSSGLQATGSDLLNQSLDSLAT
jgi:hypothetical protein